MKMENKLKTLTLTELNILRENCKIILDNCNTVLDINKHLMTSNEKKYQEMVNKRSKFLGYNEEITKEIEQRINEIFT